MEKVKKKTLNSIWVIVALTVFIFDVVKRNDNTALVITQLARGISYAVKISCLCSFVLTRSKPFCLHCATTSPLSRDEKSKVHANF